MLYKSPFDDLETISSKKAGIVNISIHSATHIKLKQLSLILGNESSFRMSDLSTLIVERFISDYKTEILDLQEKNKDLI